MSIFYARNNNESTFALFNKRANYKNNTVFENSELTYFGAEKLLYGRVNRFFVPIYAPGSRDYQFKQIRSAAVPQNAPMALNFVVDAFEDLVQQFKKALATNKISKSEPILTDIKAYTAYVDPKAQYQRHINGYKQFLSNRLRRNTDNIKDFNDFKNNLLTLVKETGLDVPFTFSAFMKNKETTSLMNTGLAIEVAPPNVKKSNDDAKVAAFLNNNNWNYFANVAKSYGFMIDSQVPWRLVADIGSSQMLAYAAVYGYGTTDQIINTYFTQAGANQIITFTRFMYDLYTSTMPSHVEIIKSDNRKVERTFDYKTLNNFKSYFDTDYMTDLYCNLRFFEDENNFSQNERNLTIDDVIEIQNFQGIGSAIRKFEFFINKPFDYAGSLGYNITSNIEQRKDPNVVRLLKKNRNIPTEDGFVRIGGDDGAGIERE